MSKFSEKLKVLIEESGLKIYRLAKNSELDRTTIQRAITGERLPSLNFVEKLSDYLRLSPDDRTELFDFYSISKIGEKIYAGRKYIKEIIERIATIHSMENNTSDSHNSLCFTGKINEFNAVFTGQYIVNNIIREVLEDEVVNGSYSEISIFVPFNYSFLFDLIYQLYLNGNGNIIIKNIIRLNKNPNAFQNSNYNLEILSYVMPFCFSAGNGYQAYYYYDYFDASNDIALLMPYYIITNKRLITISSDFKTAVLYNNESIINLYKEKFEIAVIKSQPLTSQHFYCNDLLLAYLESYKNLGEVSHVSEPQPCLAWYYTEELIMTHLRQEVENLEMILNLLYNLYGTYKNLKSRPISIFSIQGLSNFANTGILADLPIQFAIPFTVNERIVLLKNLKDDMVNDNFQVFATDPLKFTIPDITIQLYKTKGLDFFATNNNGSISSSFIEEKSIAESFYDFFESLPESDLVYSKEETIRIIDSFMEQLRDNN
jgi:transcriptional regulator with XRE-family HTH domain